MNKRSEWLRDILANIPGVEISSEDRRVDLIGVNIAGRAITFQVVSCGGAYPRDIRNAVWAAKRTARPSTLMLVAAPSLAPGSRDWLRQEGIAYCDETGHLFIAADGVYIDRDVSRPTGTKSSTPRRSETNIFRGRASQVLHALLHIPARPWHVTDLADEAAVAPGTALRVCDALEKSLLMEREGRGPQSLRRLTDPGKLLDEWAREHRLSKYDIGMYYRWHGDIDALAREIGEVATAQGPYAATLSLGAMHRAPFLTEIDQASLLISPVIDMDRLASKAKLRPVDDGANVILLRPKNDGPFMYRREAEGLWVASDVQLYLDLNASSGRGKEQAEHLRHERLGF